jgi:hypothetical protein
MKGIVGHSKLSTTDGYFRSSGADLIGKTDNLEINMPSDDKNSKKILHLRSVDNFLRNP